MHLKRIYCANTARTLFLFLWAPLAWSANIPITVAGSTETQIAIRYTATSSAACTVTATDNNNGPVVADLDPSKFANASSDLGRTVANGFRWPTIPINMSRTVYIGGHDEIKQGIDGKWYSTALQVNSDHTITVSCNGGADTGTVHGQTTNLPLASYYPELPIPAPGSPMGMPQPTIDWSRAGRSAKYVDPITGVLIQRITGGDDSFADGLPAPIAVFQTPVIDLNGGAWTNPNNLITNQTSGTLASTSTANAPIFAGFDPTFNPSSQQHFTDILLNLYGSAGSGTVSSQWCLSIDSGQTCASFNPIAVTYTSSSGCQPSGNCTNDWIPSKNPSSNFDAWGGMRVAFGNEDLYNSTFGNVSASGSTVTNANTAGPWFYPDLKPGSKFRLTGTGCPTGLLTVSILTSPVSITTVETGLSASGCTYIDMHAGVRMVKTGSGTLNASFTARGWAARGFIGGTSGAHYNCAKTKVSYTTDCDGNAVSGTGFLCGMLMYGAQFSIYLVQDNGRMCVQSAGYGSGPGHIVGAGGVPGAWVGADSYIGIDPSNNLWKGTHIAGNYQEMPSDPFHTLDNKFTYVNLGNITDFKARAIAGGVTTLSNSIWSNWGFESPVDDNAGGSALQFNSQIGGDLPCQKVWFDSNGNFLSWMPSYGSYPNGINVCHAAPFPLVNGYSLVGQGASDNSLGPHRYNAGISLGGPFISRIIGIRKNGSFVQQTRTITNCTTASPAVCTDTANNLDPITSVAGATQGALITISGATGTGWTNLNASFYAHKIDNNTFSLYLDPLGTTPLNSTGFGTFAGTVTYTASRPIYSLQASNITDSFASTGVHGARLTINVSDGAAAFYFPSMQAGTVANVMSDADPVTIVQTSLNSTIQYYIKVSCTGCTANQVDVYTDAALTVPATFSSLSGATNYYVVYAEKCPDPAGITLPGPMYTDTGFGTPGNPKVRCVTTRLASEFESDFPAPGEHAAYPPPPTSAEATNIQKSMLHQINVGDGSVSTVDYALRHEITYAIAVNRSAGENQIDVTWVRNYGDDPPYGNRGVKNGPLTDSYALQHAPGWSMGASGIIGQTIVGFMTNPATYFVPPDNGCHSDVGLGSLPNTLTSAVTYIPGNCAPDDKVDVSIATYSNRTVTNNHNSHPAFSLSDNYSFVLGQSYPSKRQIASTNGGYTSASEMTWKADWMAPNVDQGNGQNNGDGGSCAPAITAKGGLISKITPCNSTINTKITPVYAAHQTWSYYTDMSGPGTCPGANCWTRADKTKCIAFAVNECVSGSSPGDIYVADSLALLRPDYTGCLTNDATMGTTCVFGLWPGMGWAVQIRQTPIDTNGTGARRLTQGFWLPFGQYYAYNWIATPDAKWGFFAGNPLQQRPRYRESSGTHYFAMKLPPWPIVKDTTDRTTFVPLPVRFPAKAGETIRVAFGYGENGNPANLFCTTRQETCWTSAVATPANPFVFASETQSKTSCTSGCTINIPAIAGRILFYQVEHTSGNGTILDPLVSQAIP